MRPIYVWIVCMLKVTSMTAQMQWSPVGLGCDNTVKVIHRDQNANMLYVGGAFTTAGGVAANFIAKSDGQNFSALGSGTNGDVNALCLNGTKLYVGGGFTTAGGNAASNIAVLDTATLTWSAMGQGFNGSVNAIAVYNNEIYAAGLFTASGLTPVNYIAKWDGSAWVNVGTGMDGYINVLTVYNNELYAGGWFDNADGALVGNIARWDGSSWLGLDSGVDFWVNALYVFGSDLYIGGGFNKAGSITANYIVKWNGTTETFSALAQEPDFDVRAITDRTTKVYLGGEFQNAGGNAANYVASWDGTKMEALGNGVDNHVLTLQKHKGAIYAGGLFNSAGNDPNASYIAKWCDVDAKVNGIKNICIGKSTTLSAAGANTYSWSTGQTSNSIVLAPTVTTTYTMIATRFYCQDTVIFNVTVNQLPNINIAGNTTICSGTSTTLTASGGVSYSWNGGQTVNPLVSGPVSTSTFIVWGTDANGCRNSDTSIVSVNPSPNANAGSDQTICIGTTASITASGGSFYSWNTGQTASSIYVTPTSTSSYIVNVSNIFNCEDADTVVVTVNNPLASISGNTTLCEGSSTTLAASGGNFYSWSTSASSSSIVVSPSSSTDYTVTVTDLAGCTDTETASVQVTSSILTGIIASDTVFCLGSTPQLTAWGGNTYSWNTGSTASSILVSPTASTTYTVYAFSGTCSDTASLSLVVNPNPTVTITGNTTLCAGSATTLTAGSTFTVSAYQWSTGQTTGSVVILPTTATNYSVSVTDVNCCSGSAQAAVQVNALPTLSVTAVDASCSTCCDGTATVSASGTSPFTYSWQPNGLTAQTITGLCAGTYTVCVTDGNGCSSCDTVHVNYTTGIGTMNSEALMTVYPNPFRYETTIQVNGAGEKKELVVLDITGRTVRTLRTDAGGKAVLRKEGLVPGLYLMKMAGTENECIKLIIE